MRAYTPLPWRATPDSSYVYHNEGDGHDGVICKMASTNLPLQWACDPASLENSANARLIVASPRLLEACKALVEDHRIFLHGSQWVCPFCSAQSSSVLQFPHTADCPVVIAREAIREATGE